MQMQLQDTRQRRLLCIRRIEELEEYKGLMGAQPKRNVLLRPCAKHSRGA